jgi:hypothetical protein
MADQNVVGEVWSESEFDVEEVHFGKCGANAIAGAESWASQKYVSTDTIYNRMRAANRCDVSGASNWAQIAAQLEADGFKIEILRDSQNRAFVDPRPPSDVTNFFQKHATRVVIYEPSYGQALKDFVTGLGEDSTGLRYHWLFKVGYNPGGPSALAKKDVPEGWWNGDGDNYVNNTRSASGGWNRHKGGHTVVFYPKKIIQAAKPVVAIAVFAKAQQGGGDMGLPQGWTDDGTALHNPLNKNTVIQAKRIYILSHAWDTLNVPLEQTHNVPDTVESDPKYGVGNIQTCAHSILIYTDADQTVHEVPAGQELIAIRANRDALKGELDTANQQIDDLKRQLAECQGSGGSTPTPPVDQAAVDAKATMLAVGDWLAKYHV